MTSEYHKSLDEYFADWETYAFGYGYGTGEEHVLPVVKKFFDLCPADGTGYDYRDLESSLGPAITWLLINRFAVIGIIEYGTSPRYAWLTPQGKALKSFVDQHSAEDLIRMTDRDENYCECYQNACNCGPDGYDETRICQNPFWKGYLRETK